MNIAINPRAIPGHNIPPGPIEQAKEAMSELNRFLSDHPVIETPAAAKEGGAFVERTRVALTAMEIERGAVVAPLNAQLTAINAMYRVVREPLDKVLKELRRRLTAFASAEERKRIAAADAARAAALEAERIARDAEAKEANAIAMADVGECTDAGEAIAAADAAFKTYQRADRVAARAERDVPVRIKSAMGGRALTMRTVEVLTITDAAKAIKAMGLTEKITEAILSSARDFRKTYDELPAGVSSTYERSL